MEPVLARPKPSEALKLMFNLKRASQAHHGKCENSGPNCGVSLFDLRAAAEIVSKQAYEEEALEVRRVLDSWFI